MYNQEMNLSIIYNGVRLDCNCTISTIHLPDGKTSTEDVIESIDHIYHCHEDIQEILSSDAIDEIWSLCYAEYASSPM